MSAPLTTPSLSGMPLLGNLLGMMRDPIAVFRRAQEQGGDICRINLGLFDVVALFRPEHAQHVLRDHRETYSKNAPFWEVAVELMGNSLPMSGGDFWLRQRRMMQPHFHAKGIASITELIIKAVLRSMRWPEFGHEWTTTDISPRMAPITMQVVLDSLFSTTVTPEQRQIVFESLNYVMGHLFENMLLKSLPSWIPRRGGSKYHACIDSMYGVARDIIQRRREQDEWPNDLLTMLVRTTDDQTGDTMTERQLLEETLGLFIAGYETTSVALAWSLYFLARHPEQQHRLRDQVLGTIGQQAPTSSDLSKLSYARWIMQESLRMRPPIWWMNRCAEQADVIDGYDIEPGTIVAPINYFIHRHPEFWRAPDCFDPLRFSPDRAKGRHRLAWIPFGAGPRQCIGMQLALLEGQVALCNLVQHFEIQAAPVRTGQPSVSMIYRPKDVILQIRRRHLQ